MLDIINILGVEYILSQGVRYLGKSVHSDNAL